MNIKKWALERNTSYDLAMAMLKLCVRNGRSIDSIWAFPTDEEVIAVWGATRSPKYDLVWGDQTLGEMIDDRDLWGML